MNNKAKKLEQYTEQLFLKWIAEYEGSFTYCHEIRQWMDWEPKLANAPSPAALKQRIRQHRDFEERHVHTVDVAFEYFQERLAAFLLVAVNMVLEISLE